jgi:methylase of polypeptide subunit release factors
MSTPVVESGTGASSSKTVSDLALMESKVMLKFFNDDVVVVRKPAGLGVVHIQNWIHSKFQAESGLGPNEYRQLTPMPKAMDGLVAFARTKEAFLKLGPLVQFEFVALLKGQVDDCAIGESFVINTPILKKPAETEVHVIKISRSNTAGFLTTVSLRNKLPGFRREQFRVHLGTTLNRPVVGNVSRTAGLKGQKTHGLYMSCTKITLQATNTDDTMYDIHVEIDEPSRFGKLRAIEAKFYEQRVAGSGNPSPYESGYQNFCGLEFHVTPDVLIPRRSSELIVDVAVGTLRERTKASPAYVLDLGTGSGNLLVSILHKLRHSDKSTLGWGLDASMNVFKTFQRNVIKHGVANRSQFIHGTFDGVETALQNFGPGRLNKMTVNGNSNTFAVCVCNPPYHTREVGRKKLDHRVISEEPEIAWCVAGDDPLLHYREVASVLFGSKAFNSSNSTEPKTPPTPKSTSKRRKLTPRPPLLEDGGKIIFECAPWMADDVFQLLVDTGFINVTKHDDFRNMARCVEGTMPCTV